MNMSTQSVSNVANEKQIASYTSEFRENRLAKPVDISLTVTAGHLHGRAYIWEREGTKEGDAEYQRFVCPLEEVTKVYINDNVKASPLYIQCDSQVNKVFHRKTIVVPCLENVSAIAEQINELHKKFMEKFEAKQQQEMERKREALAAERQKELAEAESKSPIPPLPAVKAPDIDIPDPLPEVRRAVPEKPAAPKPGIEKPVIEKPVIEKPAAPKPVSPLGDVEESLKALEKLGSISVPEKLPLDQGVLSAKKPESIPADPVPVPAQPVINELPPVPEIGEDIELSEIPGDMAVTPEKAPAAAHPVPDPEPAEGLEGFESAVKALKARLDGGEISADEFKAERKRLIAGLY